MGLMFPCWAQPSPEAGDSFSNGVPSSVASGNTQGHVLWPYLEGPTNCKAALGQKGSCFFSSRCSFRSPGELKGFLGGSGTAWEQSTAAGEVADKGSVEGENQLPSTPCPGLKPSRGSACGQRAPKPCRIVLEEFLFFCRKPSLCGTQGAGERDE